MKILFSFLFTFFAFVVASAQNPAQKPNSQKSKTKAVTEQKQRSRPVTVNDTAGKNNPTQKGSGMTIEQQDKPKLDEPVPDALPGATPTHPSSN